MNRRSFVQVGALAGGGLLVSALIPTACTPVQAAGPSWEPNFFIKIAPDNQITFISSQSEIGQGTSVGLSMIVADELGCKLEDLKVEFAEGSSERYQNLQDTGGSNGLRLLWDPLREAAANVRAILIAAAAQKWSVDSMECYTEEGKVKQKGSNHQIAFGDLLDIARSLAAPESVEFKPKSEYKYIGTQVKSSKNIQNALGKTAYSIDKYLPNMVFAAIERAPVWEGKLINFDDTEARKIPGVVDVFEMKAVAIDPEMDYKGGIRNGVVVIAENTWAAFEGKKALKINWEAGRFANQSNESIIADLDKMWKDGRSSSYNYKNGEQKLQQAGRTFAAQYTSAFEVNACMEPLNSVVDHRGHSIEIWAGTQAPKLTRDRIAKISGLPPASIKVNNPPAGGGFGRRYFADFVEEGVIISERLRKPVKLVWSREDTIRTNKYHPLRKEYWQAKLDAKGRPIALSNHGIVSKPNGYRPFPYGVPTVFHPALYKYEDLVLPRASWRSVFAHPWGLGLESFIDELAYEAGADPVQFRLDLLDQAEVTQQKALPWTAADLYPARLKKTLEVAAQAAHYGNRPSGIYQGVSSFAYNTSYCSQVADISIDSGQLSIHKITAVLDCGMVINPSQVKAQVEGSIIWGLGALLKDEITVKEGKVQQNNFHDYDLLRMHETPEIEVILIENEARPSGSGEQAVPGIAPAVLNAIFAASGKRIRSIPIPFNEF